MVGFEMNFYKSKNVNVIVLRDTIQIKDFLHQNKLDSVLFLDRKLTFTDSLRGYKKEKIYSIFPEWILKYNINQWQDRSSIWSIYKITKEKT